MLTNFIDNRISSTMPKWQTKMTHIHNTHSQGTDWSLTESLLRAS